MHLEQSLNTLIPAVREHAEKLLLTGAQVAQYRFGFYRIPFTSSRLEEGLYLHIWLPELVAEDLPHVHIFNLRSRILQGSLTNRLWTVHDDPRGSFRMIKATCDESTCRDLDLSELVDLQPISDNTFHKGDIYDIPCGQIHTTKINNFPTVTLMEKGLVRTDSQPTRLTCNWPALAYYYSDIRLMLAMS